MSCATAASSEKRVSRVRPGVNQMTRCSNGANEEYHPASQVIYLHGRGLDNEPLSLRQFAFGPFGHCHAFSNASRCGVACFDGFPFSLLFNPLYRLITTGLNPPTR